MNIQTIIIFKNFHRKIIAKRNVIGASDHVSQMNRTWPLPDESSIVSRFYVTRARAPQTQLMLQLVSKNTLDPLPPRPDSPRPPTSLSPEPSRNTRLNGVRLILYYLRPPLSDDDGDDDGDAGAVLTFVVLFV